jgi:hypothetical protein
VNPDRAIVGLGTLFGRMAYGGALLSAAQFEDFLRLETAIPLRVDHGPLINSRGEIADAGMVRRFAVVEYPINGLLCLGEIEDAAGFGDQLLSDIECMLSQEWLPAGWGMSLAYGRRLAVRGQPDPISAIRRRPHSRRRSGRAESVGPVDRGARHGCPSRKLEEVDQWPRSLLTSTGVAS